MDSSVEAPKEEPCEYPAEELFWIPPSRSFSPPFEASKEELDRGMRIRGAEGGTRKRNGAPKEELDRGNGAPKEELERGMRIRGAEGGTQKRNENSRPPTEELKKIPPSDIGRGRQARTRS